MNRFGALLTLLALAVGMGAAFAGTETPGMPEKVRSGYDCHFLGTDSAHLDRKIDFMSENGFNAIDVKVQTTASVFDLAGHKDEVKRLVDRAKARGMAFNVYLYPFPVNPRKDVGPFDDEKTWHRIFPQALEFARLRKEIGFASLRFDIETVSVFESFDTERMTAIAAAVRRFANGLREEDPGLVLGYMPAHQHPLSGAFESALATDSLPAYIDAWDLYNGEGYTEEVAERAARIRLAHPNNRYIAWLRPNSYRPADIAVTAYHAALNTDGYSNWKMEMLDEVTRNYRLNTMYDLPAGTVADDYLREYGRANLALDGKGAPIPWRKIEPVVPPLELEKIAWPEASALPKAVVRSGSLTLRDPQVVFMTAKAGKTIRVCVRHQAGQQRPVAVHYAVLGPDRRVIRDENVSPGGEERFGFPAARTGVYALAVSGGSSGQAWYRVSVEGATACVAGRDAYLFGPQRFCVMGADHGNPRLAILNSPVQAYRWRMNGGAWNDAVGRERTEVDLPSGVVRFEIERHQTLYCQDFRFEFPGGKCPFVMTCP